MFSRKAEERRRKKKRKNQATATSSKVSYELSSSNDTDSEHDEAFTCSFQDSHTKLKRRRASKNIVTPQLAMALDRTKVADRSAAYILNETVLSIGQNPGEFNINRSSIQRYRNTHRKSIAASLKAEFKANCLLVCIGMVNC